MPLPQLPLSFDWTRLTADGHVFTRPDGSRYESASRLFTTVGLNGVAHTLELIEVVADEDGLQSAVIPGLDGALRLTQEIIGGAPFQVLTHDGRSYVAILVPWAT